MWVKWLDTPRYTLVKGRQLVNRHLMVSKKLVPCVTYIESPVLPQRSVAATTPPSLPNTYLSSVQNGIFDHGSVTAGTFHAMDPPFFSTSNSVRLPYMESLVLPQHPAAATPLPQKRRPTVFVAVGRRVCPLQRVGSRQDTFTLGVTQNCRTSSAREKMHSSRRAGAGCCSCCNRSCRLPRAPDHV